MENICKYLYLLKVASNMPAYYFLSILLTSSYKQYACFSCEKFCFVLCMYRLCENYQANEFEKHGMALLLYFRLYSVLVWRSPSYTDYAGDKDYVVHRTAYKLLETVTLITALA